MIRTTLTILLASAVAMLAAPGSANAQEGSAAVQATSVPTKKGHVEANGVSYYYEIHGKGEPLVLLHGGLGSIDMFAPVMPILAEGREVIGVDLYGHGRTALTDRPVSLIDMGDDLATILTELGYDQVDVLGYSMGAGVGFRLAVQHPDKVRRLALASAPFAQDGFFPEMLPPRSALPDLTHYEAFASPAMAHTVLPFLNGVSNAPDWAKQVEGQGK